MAIKKGLGKGLDALISEQIIDVESSVVQISINRIEPNKNQPRKSFSEESLNELKQSIIEYGIIQPLIVKEEDGYYEIIAGERRWRAARLAGLNELPVILRNASELESLELALIENIQRENLNPIEEAETYKKLMDELGLMQEQVADKVGKSRSAIANAVRLLHLDERVRNLVLENKISAGHARALLGLEDNDLQFEIAEKIIEEGFSVRATEVIVNDINHKKSKTQAEQKELARENENYRMLETNLKKIFGTTVKISSGKNKGKIEIEYYSVEELDRLYELLKKLDN